MLSCIVCHVAGELVVSLTAVSVNSNGIGSMKPWNGVVFYS